ADAELTTAARIYDEKVIQAGADAEVTQYIKDLEKATQFNKAALVERLAALVAYYDQARQAHEGYNTSYQTALAALTKASEAQQAAQMGIGDQMAVATAKA